MKKIIRYIALVVNIIIAVALVLAYFVPETDPRVFWPGSLLGLAYPLLIIINACFIVFWGIFHWKYLFVSFIAVALGFAVHTTYFRYPVNVEDESAGIKVLSFNVQHFYSYLEGKKNDESVLNFIAAQEAHIICLQETKLQRRGNLNPLKLKVWFPGIVHCQLAHQSQWGGPVTFTSFPIVHMGEIRFDDSSNLVIYTDVNTGIDTIRIYNCHLQSFGINDEEKAILDSISLKNRQVDKIRNLTRKLRDAYILRATQVDRLVGHIKSCPYPVIVCGDFNDTPVSYTYRKISSVLTDSFVESGKGISGTHRNRLLPFRIDYIFYSHHFESHHYKRHRVNYSDHYPVTAVLERIDEVDDTSE
ncbi:MAG: endonuclease/exonuclease/phosphatase family protein [Prolixibacteraceae bacterium]|nr:endonuclease/exonuclease/phosphatase family protein [Prolixibacteraceae bacterium]